jgi:hypothetical protein|tara:strand:- start:647 stop:1165 length:519 start_codon:yes stop_codon:yes gene_type:complete
MKKARFDCVLSQEEKVKLEKTAEAIGLTSSGLFRLFIKKLPANNDETIIKNTQKNNSIVRISFRIDQETYSRIKETTLIGKNQSPSAFAKKVLIASIEKKPILMEEETSILKESNFHLSIINNNINQIAKSLNINPKNSNQVIGIDFESIQDLLSKNLEAVRSLYSSSLERA